MESVIQILFGKCIHDYRTSMGLSQEKFARLIDMDRTYYASVESGKRNISLLNIIKISKGFGVKTSEVFKKILRIVIYPFTIP